MAVGIVAVLLTLTVADNRLSGEARAAGVRDATGGPLGVTATGTFSFTPNLVSDLPLDTAVSVTFTNGDLSGAIHTFTIIGCENVSIPAGGDPSTYINGTQCSKAPLLNLVPAAKSSASGTIAPVATVGWYEFVCTEPGHFSQGMYGYIGFGVTPPFAPSSGNNGPGVAVFIIVGTIVALTVIAIVLGFVVGRREGAKHEMPPERLGYAEPPPGTPPPGGPPLRP
jgi:hypothetical protein